MRTDQETTGGGARTHARTSGTDGDRCSLGDGKVVDVAGSDSEATITGAAGFSHRCVHTAQSLTGTAGP